MLALAALAFVTSGCGGSERQAQPSRAGDTEGLRVSTEGWRTDFSKHTVALAEFERGAPRDGIPALDEPSFVSVREADGWLEQREPVIELVLEGKARAYPLQILVWHEIVNDTVAGVPVAVTFCPLCNTALVFDRRLGGRVLDFGVSGNLRNSDLVMVDRQTESWWQQFGGEALTGELAGEELEQLPATIVAWEEFARTYPNGSVLSRETGHARQYGQNPYSGYDDVDSPPFFTTANSDDDRLQPKERVVYIERSGEAIAIPFSALAQTKQLEVTVAGELLEVVWLAHVRSALDSAAIASGREVGSARVRSLATGQAVLFDMPFWFAVAAFRPDVRIVRG